MRTSFFSEPWNLCFLLRVLCRYGRSVLLNGGGGETAPLSKKTGRPGFIILGGRDYIPRTCLTLVLIVKDLILVGLRSKREVKTVQYIPRAPKTIKNPVFGT